MHFSCLYCFAPRSYTQNKSQCPFNSLCEARIFGFLLPVKFNMLIYLSTTCFPTHYMNHKLILILTKRTSTLSPSASLLLLTSPCSLLFRPPWLPSSLYSLHILLFLGEFSQLPWNNFSSPLVFPWSTPLYHRFLTRTITCFYIILEN